MAASVIVYLGVFVTRCIGDRCHLFAPEIFHFVPVVCFAPIEASLLATVAMLAMTVHERKYFCETGLDDVSWAFTYVYLTVAIVVYVVRYLRIPKEGGSGTGGEALLTLMQCHVLLTSYLFFTGVPLYRVSPSPYFPLYSSVLSYFASPRKDEPETIGILVLIVLSWVFAFVSFVFSCVQTPTTCQPFVAPPLLLALESLVLTCSLEPFLNEFRRY